MLTDLYLESSRLQFFRPSQADLPFIEALIGNRALTNHPGSLPEGPRVAEIANWIVNHWSNRDFGPCIVKLRGEHSPVGIAGLKEIDLHGKPAIDMGMSFLNEHQGQGLGFEAGVALLGHGFNVHVFKRIVARTTLDNASALRLLEKWQFQPAVESGAWELTRDRYLTLH